MARKTRAKKEVPTAASIALQLLEIRSQMNLLKKDDLVLTKMLKDMIRTGQGGTQTTYQLRKDLQLAIADQEKARQWAIDQSVEVLLKVDIPGVDKYLKQNRMAIPSGFALKEVEKLVEVKEGEIAPEEFIITG